MIKNVMKNEEGSLTKSPARNRGGGGGTSLPAPPPESREQLGRFRVVNRGLQDSGAHLGANLQRQNPGDLAGTLGTTRAPLATVSITQGSAIESIKEIKYSRPIQGGCQLQAASETASTGMPGTRESEQRM